MLYHFFDYLNSIIDLPGSGMMRYISFRSVAAVVTALLIVIFCGKSIIRALQRHQIGEEIRDLGLEGQLAKTGTPTMGGIIILLAIIVPVLLFARLDNIYTILLLVATLWCGVIGFLDDYIKVFRHNKEGLQGKFKIVGQVGLGLIVGTVMCFSEDIVVREHTTVPVEQSIVDEKTGETIITSAQQIRLSEDVIKTTKTTIPFLKNNELDYSWFVGGNELLSWVLYVLVAIFVITAVSNGANLTDGLDGLLTGVSIPIVGVLAVLAYLSGNIIYADYLNIMSYASAHWMKHLTTTGVTSMTSPCHRTLSFLSHPESAAISKAASATGAATGLQTTGYPYPIHLLSTESIIPNQAH